ncbi:hypothetical protein SLE2022_020860 [Rubroshorea leprosula]
METTVGKRATGDANFSDPEVGYPEDKKLKKVDDPFSTEPSVTQSESELKPESDSELKPESDFQKFYRQKRESYGFDVDVNPFKDDDYFCYFAAFNDPYAVPFRGKECTELAMEAVEYHNLNKKAENANLEFVKLVKFCHEYMRHPYEMYYITFDAKNVVDGCVQTCQAKVLCDSTDENTLSRFRFTPKVIMFKKKGEMDFIGLDPELDGIPDCACGGSGPCNC